MKSEKRILALSGILLCIFLISKAQPTDVIMWYDCDHGALINSRPDHGWWNLNPGYPNDPVAGGLLSNNYYYLKRASDGTILATSRPPESDVFKADIWNTSQYKGTEVYIEIVDNNSESEYEWLAADNFMIGDDTLNFETGNYADWQTISGTAFGTTPNSVRHGSMSGQGSKFWADSWKNSLNYDSNWETGAWEGYYNNSCHYAWKEGAAASFAFTGTGIKWIAAENSDHGKADVYIDGSFRVTVDLYSESVRNQVVVFKDSLLSDSPHIIEIKVTGTKNSYASGTYVDIDAFETATSENNDPSLLTLTDDNGGGSAAGVLRSKIFTVSTNVIKFLKAGWDGPGGTGPWRTTTSLLGTYESQDSSVIKQHAYWIRALGCNVMASDLTNTESVRKPGASGDILRFYTGINTAFELELKYLAGITEFEAPAVFPVIRLSGANYGNLTLLLDDLYALFQEYPDKWYKLSDGTADSNKPFIEIFADGSVLNTWTQSGIPSQAKDSRYNIRYSNGYLLAQSAITQPDHNIRKIPARLPYWLFVENATAGNGYYQPVYKEKPDGQGVEQMITWASVNISGNNWDGLRDTVDGKTPIVRYTEPVYNLKPQVLMAARFNYPLAWLTEPQEGVSRNKGTHIEPNVDWGFLEFNEVADELYNVRNYAKNVPPTPALQSFDTIKGLLRIKLDGFPLEYRIADHADFNDMPWTFLNVGKGGINISGLNQSQVMYIQTRNSFGESQVGRIKAGTLDTWLLTVDDKDNGIHYDRIWENGAWEGYYNNSCHYTWKAGETASYTFTGTGIQWIAATNSDHGMADVYIDGSYQATVDLYSASGRNQMVVFADSLLPDCHHTIEIKVTGTKNPDASGTYVDIDAFEIASGIAGINVPDTPGLITGPASVCNGTRDVVYNVSPIAGATSYIWTLPAGATGSSNTGSISVSFESATVGSIKVKGLNDCGYGPERFLAVTVHEIPATPVITLNEDGILQSSSVNGNQWYFNNNIIEDAINSTLLPSQIGDYYAVVTLHQCSSQHSDKIAFNPTAIGDVIKNSSISVLPNPTTGAIKISLSDKFDADYTLEVYDNLGVLLQAIKKNKSESVSEIDLSRFPAGYYIIRIHGIHKSLQTKLLKE